MYAQDAALVVVAQGTVRGRRAQGVRSFLGIPYAAPPVGERRFALPQPPDRWAGIRDADRPGPNAPQFMRAFPQLDVAPLVGHGWSRGDEFLTLNVWAPDGATTDRPVMVFIHGGAFVLGSKDAAVHDGSAFARSGIVCVAINYRLGIEGFLPLGGAPTNLGLRDQLAALQWVRDNIHAFGGDPRNVTVFGESAGAMSVACLVASPLAQGLFSRAIVQSGHGSMVRSLEVAQRLTRKVAGVLRVAPDRSGFASRSVEDCTAALERVQSPRVRIDLRDTDGREPAYGLSRFLPVYGDDVLPEPPLDALRRGVGADVQLLLGTNAEEMNLYFVPTRIRRRLPGWLARYMLRRVEPRAADVLRAYGLGERGRRAGDAFTEAMHDLVFRWPARRYAAAHRGRTHFYEFDWQSPACAGALGACHGVELPFVFDSLPTVTGPMGLAGTSPPQALADRVHATWVRFATDGQLPWGEYRPGSPVVYRLARGVAAPEPELALAHVLG
jgi:para-nitrobenzyl esterase